MTQSAISISENPPLPGLQLVQQANDALETVATDFAGDNDPAASAGPFTKWADTQNGLLKRRNAAGTAWVTEGALFRQRIDTYPADAIPTSDQGPINVLGYGLMEYENSIYNRYISVQPLHGQCRLIFVSGTQLQLIPKDGQGLVINGRTERVPSNLVVSNAGLAAQTRYYLYAYMSAGVMALELSAAGHATNLDGVEIKAGDPTRTLVGMVYTTTGAIFADSVVARNTASWFNRLPKSVSLTAADSSTSSNINVLIAQGTGLSWGDSINISLMGHGTANTAVASLLAAYQLDGSTRVSPAATIPGVNYSSAISGAAPAVAVAEGIHTHSLYFRAGVGGQTVTLNARTEATVNL